MQGKTFNIIKVFIKKNLSAYVLIFSVIILLSLIYSVVNPEIFRRIVKFVIKNDYHPLVSTILLFAVSVIVSVFFESFNKLLTFSTNRKLLYEMENQLLEYYSKSKYWNFTIKSPKVLALFRQNITCVTSDFNEFLKNLISLSFSIIFTIVYAVTINLSVLLISIATTGVMIALSQRQISKLPAMFEKITNDRNKLHEIIWEHIRNTEVAGFLNNKRTAEGYVNANEDYLSNWLAAKKINNRSQLFSQFGGKILVLLIAVFSGIISTYGKVEISDIFALIIVIPNISNSLFLVPNRVADFKQLKGKFKAMDEFFIIEKEMEGDEASDMPAKLAGLSLSKLSFRYPDQEKNVLDDISLDFTGGLVCLTGKSGCGKSTLLRICAKLIPYDTGRVLWNSIDIRKYDRTKLWEKVGYLNQMPYIIPGTLIRNITLGKNVKNHQERLAKAIYDANLTDFLEKNASGVDTEIDITKLSNGEIQKICFARMFYQEYDILLLDEATSALDPSAELFIINSLKRRVLNDEIMVIAVAHKLCFLENADEVILLKDGKVEARGKYIDLMKFFAGGNEE